MDSKDYFKTAKNLNLSTEVPNEDQIEVVITKIEARLAEKVMNRAANRSVKEGYTMAVEMLRRRRKTMQASKNSQRPEQGLLPLLPQII